MCVCVCVCMVYEKICQLLSWDSVIGGGGRRRGGGGRGGGRGDFLFPSTNLSFDFVLLLLRSKCTDAAIYEESDFL